MMQWSIVPDSLELTFSHSLGRVRHTGDSSLQMRSADQGECGWEGGDHKSKVVARGFMISGYGTGPFEILAGINSLLLSYSQLLKM